LFFPVFLHHPYHPLNCSVFLHIINSIQFTKVDGGYTATDFVLKQLLNAQECKWLSVTNADNVYGSEVVDRVLRFVDTSTAQALAGKQPNMLLAPIDSRNFAAIGTYFFCFVLSIVHCCTSCAFLYLLLLGCALKLCVCFFSLFFCVFCRNADYFNRHGKKAEWKQGCKGINAAFELMQVGFVVQPIAFLGHVDLAAMFMRRQALKETGVLFGTYSTPFFLCCSILLLVSKIYICVC
jgi:hypothetical protein